MINVTIWKPIKSYRSQSFNPHEVWVRAEGQKPVRASYGWDDEQWDSWSDAWHKEDSLDSLGFDPEEWCELEEYNED